MHPHDTVHLLFRIILNIALQKPEELQGLLAADGKVGRVEERRQRRQRIGIPALRRLLHKGSVQTLRLVLSPQNLGEPVRIEPLPRHLLQICDHFPKLIRHIFLGSRRILMRHVDGEEIHAAPGRQIAHRIDIAVAGQRSHRDIGRRRYDVRVHRPYEVLVVRAERRRDTGIFRPVDKVVLRPETRHKAGEHFHRSGVQIEALKDLHRSENIRPHALRRMRENFSRLLYRRPVNLAIAFRQTAVRQLGRLLIFQTESQPKHPQRLFRLALRLPPDDVSVFFDDIHKLDSPKSLFLQNLFPKAASAPPFQAVLRAAFPRGFL